MKTAVSQICISLLFSICSISLLKAQEYGENFNSVDVAVLMQIKSQGGTFYDSWNTKKPYRLTSLGIKNMKGNLDVSRCSALTDLWCPGNQLTSLDASGCLALSDLDCSDNQLTSLNVSGCTNLINLRCSDNQLASLNISGCQALTDLVCSNNQLTKLDLSGYLTLIGLSCSNNQLTSLNVKGCSALTSLRCNNNQLTSLNVSGCSALSYLECCNGNQLTNLNVSGCSALTNLRCFDNQLTSLDISGCYSLKILECDDNQLISINIIECSALTHLRCNDNQLTSLKVNGCSALELLDCDNNQLICLNISGCSSLTYLNCFNNPLTSLNASGCSVLPDLSCFSNQLTSLDVSGCTALQTLYCNGNQLTSLDVSECSALTFLRCFGNQLTSLNVTGCSALSNIECNYNQLTSLDVSGCSALQTLVCNENKITNLDISECPALQILDCNANRLTSLNLCKNTALTKLYCSKNSLTFLNLKNSNNRAITDMSSIDNPNLYCIEVDDPNSAATFDNWHKDNWANYCADCSIKPFSLENNWTVTKTSGMPEHPIGVVADGCSAIKINLIQNDKSITVNDVDIRVFDINNENIPTGNIGTSISQATAPYLLEDLTYLPDAIFYVAPDLVSYDILYKNEWNRKVVVQITINNNSDYILYDTINIIRPPVLLIHGLNSDYKCFSQLQAQLLDTELYKTGQAYCVDYSPTNQAAFEENSHVLPNSIKGIKRDWTEKGYAVSKLDIVGHSMGGILSRLYLQSSYYDDDIHKLITLNTPHSGSHGANVLVKHPKIRELIGLNGKAVDDLQVSSYATRTLLNDSSVSKKNIVPSHAIITETTVLSEAIKRLKNPFYSAISCAFLLEKPIFTLNGVIEYTRFNNWLHNDVYNDDNDLVVAVNSQRGGLNSSTVVHNEWHCGSPDNETVRSNIFRLLLLPSTDASFSTQGFNPLTLDYGKNAKDMSAKLRSSVINKDSVYFISPEINATTISRDSITIEVARTADVKNLIFMAIESQDSVYLKDTTATSMRFKYHIPTSVVGNIPMYVFGADTLGNEYIDSISITISPNATAQSLAITYPDDATLEISQGLKSSVRVSCLFSDNVNRDITTLPDVQYTTKMENAVVISKGIIKGVHKGLDTLIVSYAGLSCSLPIIVNQNYTCNVNASVSPDNSGNATGTGTFFYGDSVTLVATPESGYAFDYWSENGIEISNNINYSFEIYSSKNLVANFKSSTDVKNISINNNLVSIYPNPNDGNFTVNIDADYTGEVVINIFSVTGVQCDRIEFIKSVNKTTHEINSKCLEKGIYLVNILLGEDLVTKKIIID